MASIKSITGRQVGKNLNVNIEGEAFTLTGTKEELAPAKEALKLAMEKPTKKNVDSLKKLLTPKTTKEVKEVEEKAKEEEVSKKVNKRKIKEIQKESKEELKEVAKRTKEDSKILSKLVSDKVLIPYSNGYILRIPDTGEDFEHPKIVMPDLLIEKIVKRVKEKKDITPFINFWILSLGNPNAVARYKLFNYLELHNLIITPSGYFVTYRMVKKTEDPNTFTHAHNGTPRLYYKVGTVAKLDRKKDCDEDGANDCSRGIHFGSPKFIGIEVPKGAKGLGEGYETTKAQSPSSYGTGYDSPKQNFDETFGNQATIWLINPMHVVSIPNSDTRKMRACEGYFAKLTDVEEVVKHLTDESFDIFDTEYKDIEAKDIIKNLKKLKLDSYSDGTLEKQQASRKVSKSAKLKQLEELKANQANFKKVKVSSDSFSKDLSAEQIQAIIKTRVVK